MSRTRIISALAAAVVLLAAVGCGSSSGSASRSTHRTASTTTTLRLAAAATGAAPTASDAAGATMMPARPVTYVLDVPLPDLGSTAVVDRMVPHRATLADVRRFAAALGLAGAPIRTASGWTVTAGGAQLAFTDSADGLDVSYGPAGSGGSASGAAGSTGTSGSGGATVASPPPPSGAVSPGGPTVAHPPSSVVAPPSPMTTTVTTTATTTPTTTTPTTVVADVPDPSHASALARQLLDRLGVLVGQQWSAQVVDDGGAIAVSCPAGVPCPTSEPRPAAVSERTVTFTLVVGGGPIEGITWSVTIGAHGRVDALDGSWATPSAIGSYPLAATAAAFAALQRGDARFVDPQPEAVVANGQPEPVGATAASTEPALVVHVVGVSLGWARWDAFVDGTDSIDLVPTYRFRATAEGSSGGYDIDVLALAPTAVAFTGGSTTPVPAPGVTPVSAVAPAHP